MLALDLGFFHRKAHVVEVREALVWTFVWISSALFFNLGVFYWFGSEKALEFLTGYLIEKSLSMDNVFVFLMIFSYFRVPTQDSLLGHSKCPNYARRLHRSRRHFNRTISLGHLRFRSVSDPDGRSNGIAEG